MFYFSRAQYDRPTKGIVDKQIGDPFKKWIDGEIITENLFDEFHNYLFGEKVFENTDPLIKEKGFRVLDKMLDTDANIKNSYWSRIFTILSGGYSIDSAMEGSDRAEEISDFVDWNLNVFLQTSISSFLRKMLDGSRQGFKIAEIVWRVIEDGKYAGKIGLYDLIVRDSRNYSFLTDNAGRIDPMGVIEGISSTGYQTQTQPRQLPADKFIIYSYLALNDDAASIYGNSDFRALWRAFYGDITAHRLELRSSETFARPPLVGQVDNGEFTKPEQSKIQQDAVGIYNRVYTQIPAGVKIEEIGSKRADTNAFKSLRDRHSAQVQSAMLMGYQGGDNSSTDVKIKTDTLLITLDAISSDLSDVVMQRQVIRKLVDLNYKTNLYPLFLVPKLSIDRKLRSEFVKTLVEIGVAAPDEPWIRGFCDIPKQDMASRERQLIIKKTDTALNPAAPGAIPIAGSLGSGLSQFSMDEKELILEASSPTDINQVDNVNSIVIENKLDFMVIIKEKDNGAIKIDSKVKEGINVSDFEKHLESIVDESPENKFFVARVFGEYSKDGKSHKVMKVIRAIAASPDKNRVSMIFAA